MPARRARRATRSLIASSRIGAPTGPRNRFTNTKSLEPRPRHGHPLELVGVERLHRQEIQRHRPLAAGLGQRPVRVVLPAHHVQVRARDPAPQRPGIGQQVDIAAAQPAAPRRGAARPGPSAARSAGRAPNRTRPARATTSPSPARSTRVSGSCSRCRARIRQPSPLSSPRAAPEDPGHQRPHTEPGLGAREPALRDRVHDHPPDSGQHRVDPPRRADRRNPRASQDGRSAAPGTGPPVPRAPARS